MEDLALKANIPKRKTKAEKSFETRVMKLRVTKKQEQLLRKHSEICPEELRRAFTFSFAETRKS